MKSRHERYGAHCPWISAFNLRSNEPTSWGLGNQDLTSIGYHWPPLVTARTSGVSTGAADILSQPLQSSSRRHHPPPPPLLQMEPIRNITTASRDAVEQYTINPDHTAPLLPRWWCRQPDLVLIIMYNHPVHARTVELLNRAYRSMFYKARARVF